MKIIDNEGMIFKKINIIDLLIIFFLLSFLPVFFYGYKLSVKAAERKMEATKIAENHITTELYFKFYRVNPKELAMVSANDKELNSDGEQVAEIVSIIEIVPSEMEISVGSSEFKKIKETGLKDIIAKVKIYAELRPPYLFYKGKRIEIGSVVDFTTTKYILQAIVVDNLFLRKEWVSVKMDLPLLVDIIADNIKSGYLERGIKGEIIGKLIKIISDEPVRLGAVDIEADDSSELCAADLDVFTLRRTLKDGRLANKIVLENLGMTSAALKTAPEEAIVAAFVKILKMRDFYNKINVDLYNARLPGKIKELLSKARFSNSTLTDKDFMRLNRALLEAIYPVEVRNSQLKKNRHFILTTPNQRHLTILVSLFCSEKDGQFYFGDKLIKIGNQLCLTSDAYTVTGSIVEVEGN